MRTGSIVIRGFSGVCSDHGVVHGEIWVVSKFENESGVVEAAVVRDCAEEEETGNEEIAICFG